MKKIYKSMCVMCALVLGTMSLMANSVTYSGEYLGKGGNDGQIIDSNFVYPAAGNHLSNFKIHHTDGQTITYRSSEFATAYTHVLSLGKVQNGTLTFEITWEEQPNYKVKMTKISVEALMENSGFSTDQLSIGNGEAKELNAATYQTVSCENTEDGIANGVQMKLVRSDANNARYLWIRKIILEFKVYPTLVSADPQPIKVTMDAANPNTIDLANYIYTDEHLAEGSAPVYSCEDKTNVVLNGSVAYAVAGGEYNIIVFRGNVQDCHEAVADTMKLQVERFDPTLEVLIADTALFTTVNPENQHAADLTSMYSYTAGDGEISYAVTAGEVSEASIEDALFSAKTAGKYTVTIASAQTAFYNAASVTVDFDVQDFFATLEDTTDMVYNDVLATGFQFADTLGMQFIVEPAGVITFNQETMEVTAIGDGTAKLTISQEAVPGQCAAINKEYVFNVTGTPAALAETAEKAQVKKMLINGQLVIVRDDKLFNAQGAEIR